MAMGILAVSAVCFVACVLTLQAAAVAYTREHLIELDILKRRLRTFIQDIRVEHAGDAFLRPVARPTLGRNFAR